MLVKKSVGKAQVAPVKKALKKKIVEEPESEEEEETEEEASEEEESSEEEQEVVVPVVKKVSKKPGPNPKGPKALLPETALPPKNPPKEKAPPKIIGQVGSIVNTRCARCKIPVDAKIREFKTSVSGRRMYYANCEVCQTTICRMCCKE
jgi:hypothetical protein